MATLAHISQTLMTGVRRDPLVRWGLGAGASVLLSAGVWGMGGVTLPDFSRGSNPSVPVAHAAAGFEVIDMATSTVADIVAQAPEARRFDLMLYNSGTMEALSQGGTYTVFVPSSKYFDYLPKGYIAGLSRPQMNDLSLRHIVGRVLPMQETLNGTVITEAQSTVSFKVDIHNQSVSVGDAKVLRAYRGSNGIVYIIDRVLVPTE